MARCKPTLALVPDGLTPAQAAILNKFATIEAELSCLVRETKRTRITLDSKRTRRKHDKR